MEAARRRQFDRPRDALMRTIALCSVHPDGSVTRDMEFALG